MHGITLKKNPPNFFVPFEEIVENEEEECDTELERQNIEELYDYVRRVHQREGQEVTSDVQHKALIPVLRPYQCQAVNWMLRREKYTSSSPKGHKNNTARCCILFFTLVFNALFLQTVLKQPEQTNAWEE